MLSFKPMSCINYPTDSAAPSHQLLICCCRSAKDFEEYGRLVAGKYLVTHSRNPQYKTLLKTLFKAALAPLPVQVPRVGICGKQQGYELAARHTVR